MLTKNAKRILKYARKSSSHEVLYSTLEDELHIPRTELSDSCSLLVKHELAETYGTRRMGNVPVNYCLRLTEYGRHYNELKRNQILKFVLCNIATPIIVTLITELILHGVPLLLQQTQ